MYNRLYELTEYIGFPAKKIISANPSTTCEKQNYSPLCTYVIMVRFVSSGVLIKNLRDFTLVYEFMARSILHIFKQN